MASHATKIQGIRRPKSSVSRSKTHKLMRLLDSWLADESGSHAVFLSVPSYGAVDGGGGTDDLSRARSPVIYLDGDYNWHGAPSSTCRLEVPLADRFFRLLVDLLVNLLADTLQYMSTAHVALVSDYGQ